MANDGIICANCRITMCAVTSESETRSVKPVAEVMTGASSRRARKLNAKGETQLHVAARLNKVGDVVSLLMEGADINARDYAGRHES